MINAASPDLSSKTCGSVRAHATDRRWKTSFDFHRRPGVGVGATGALLRDCHQNSWVIFKWPNSRINPFKICVYATQREWEARKRGRERITSESQKSLILGVQTRYLAENKPPCTNSSRTAWCFKVCLRHLSCFVQIKWESLYVRSLNLQISTLKARASAALTSSVRRCFTTRASPHVRECVRGRRPSASDLRVTFLRMTCDKTGQYGSKWLASVCDRATSPGPYHMF